MVSTPSVYPNEVLRHMDKSVTINWTHCTSMHCCLFFQLFPCLCLVPKRTFERLSVPFTDFELKSFEM